MADEIISWVEPDGTEVVLGVSWGVEGRFMPPVKIEEDEVPGWHGAVARQVKAGVREFTLPLWIGSHPLTGVHFADESALREGMRDIVSRMNPMRGAGRVRVQSPVGDSREIVCRYVGGLEMSESLGDNTGLTAQKAAVTFRAHEPFWTTVSDVVHEFDVGVIPSFFPIFPIRLTSSEVFADTTIDNAGDVETWPVWELTGPGELIVLRNLTTGKKIDLSNDGGFELGIGESLTIDTRQGKKTLTSGDGESQFSKMSNDSSLWPLVRGQNAVRLEMTGSNTQSLLSLRFKPRFLAP